MYRLIVSLVLVVLTAPDPLHAQEKDSDVIAGVVEEVLTADIAHVLTRNGYLYVRLAGVDAPDLRQPYGEQAHALLTELISQKPVTLRRVSMDRCGRTVVMMWVNDTQAKDISSQMVMQGAAWVYRQYTDSAYLLDLEQQARANKVGLWQLPEKEQIEPWEFRKKLHLQGGLPYDECTPLPRRKAL